MGSVSLYHDESKREVSDSIERDVFSRTPTYLVGQCTGASTSGALDELHFAAIELLHVISGVLADAGDDLTLSSDDSSVSSHLSLQFDDEDDEDGLLTVVL